MFTLIVNLNHYPSLKVLNNILEKLQGKNVDSKKIKTALNKAVTTEGRGLLYQLKVLLGKLAKEKAQAYLAEAETIDDYEFVLDPNTTSTKMLKSPKLKELVERIKREENLVVPEASKKKKEVPAKKATKKKRRFALEEAKEVGKEEEEIGTETEGELEAEEARAKLAARAKPVEKAAPPKLQPFREPIVGQIWEADLMTKSARDAVIEVVDNGFGEQWPEDQSPDAAVLKKPGTIFVGADLPYFCTDYEWDQEKFVGCTKQRFPEYFVRFLLDIFEHHDGMAIIFANSNYQLDDIRGLLAHFMDENEDKCGITGITNLYVDRVQPSAKAMMQRNRLNLVSNVETALQVC